MRLRRSPLGLGVPRAKPRIVRLARDNDVFDVGLGGRREAGAGVGTVDRAEPEHDGVLDRLGIGVVAILVELSAAMLGRDGEAAPSLGQSTVDESEGEEPSKASESERRLSPALVGTTPRGRRRIGVQDGSGVVVVPGMLRVHILGEHDELTRIVCPIAQGI